MSPCLMRRSAVKLQSDTPLVRFSSFEALNDGPAPRCRELAQRKHLAIPAPSRAPQPRRLFLLRLRQGRLGAAAQAFFIAAEHQSS